MLTRKEYEQIERKMERYVDGTWLVEAMRTGAGLCNNHILEILRADYVQKEEQPIDCDAINKAIRDGKIIVAKSRNGITIIPANSRKSDHDIMFENCINNAESKMRETETDFYFKEGGRNAGRCFGGVSTDVSVEAAKCISETMAMLNKGCYAKSDETEKEQWERLNGHQKCMKAAADVEYELYKKNKTIPLDKTIEYCEEKAKENRDNRGDVYRQIADQFKELKTGRSVISSGCISIEKDENGQYKYSDKTQEVIARLEVLENKMKLIEKREGEHVNFRLAIDSLLRRVDYLERR